jgi:ATP-dependent Clp protease ATP-binding subunit ClpX
MSEENNGNGTGLTEAKLLECSFCGKRQDQVKKLIAGPNVYICDECIDLCHNILKNDDIPAQLESGAIPTPKKIKEFLDQYVIGQDYAKRVLAIAVSSHYKRLANPIIDDVELEKSNVLMYGPSGAGKCVTSETEFNLKISSELYHKILEIRNKILR